MWAAKFRTRICSGSKLIAFTRYCAIPVRSKRRFRAFTENRSCCAIASRAGDHDREITVGSVSNPTWQYPNVMAEITVWDGEAIELIESGEQADLSAGYFYRP